jgi:hypothetical protein
MYSRYTPPDKVKPAAFRLFSPVVLRDSIENISENVYGNIFIIIQLLFACVNSRVIENIYAVLVTFYPGELEGKEYNRLLG